MCIWARRCTNYFTKKTRRVLFGEIDNMVWCGEGNEIAQWCKRNKVYDEITEKEIEEIWNRESPENDDPIRLNGKYVWETAKRVCNFINSHDDIISISSFGEYRNVMKKVMKVIKEAHLVERKRRQTSRKKRALDKTTTTQRAKTLITKIKRGEVRREEVERRLEEIFGQGSREEIEHTSTNQEIAERIEEMAKREEQFTIWEKMRRDAKMRQREDRRLNIFWRRNKCFPAQYGGEDETPDPEETLTFWRSINNKEVSEDGEMTGTSEEPWVK